MDTASSPLHVRRVLWTDLIINRLHMLFNGIAILAVFHYRFATLSRIIETRDTPILPYLIVTISEIVLTFLWILHQAYRWIPVTRTAYPENLPEDEKLPPIDVFVCTADPSKEPSLGVMNTVISAMALDYPSCKLSVYLSDDGGSHVTLDAVREAWKFARFWIPFCRNYELKIRCPESYFSSKESAEKFVGSSEFIEDRKTIEKRYDEFKEALDEISVNARSSVSKDHPPTIEVMTDEIGDSNLKEMPLLVYVAREKRPGCPHHFKGGALNNLLRVSALLSNAPYFLVLDCDMYCYDPTSARQAMCFFLDPKISPKLDRVQFLQKFRNISKYDIYDGRLNPIWREGQGMDGIKGPAIYGCNFFMTREAIYGTKKIRKDVDLNHLKKSFGSSNEFIKSLYESYKPQLPENRKPSDALQNELQLVASCTYDNATEWGKELGCRYFSVAEDSITAIEMYCNGGISVQIDPERPCFLGASPTNLNDVLVQQTRWSFGLMQIGLSRFSPLVYCPLKMGVLQSMCFASYALDCLYTVPFYGLAIIPPICLLYGIPLYPKMSDPIFLVFVYILLSSLLKHVQEIFFFGDRDAFRTALYELRIWLMKCGACYSYALLNSILDKLGFLEANFTLTNKVVDDEQSKRHEQGIYDFQVSTRLLAPLCSVYFLNLTCFIIGITRIFHNGDKLVGQLSLSLFAIVINYHFLEGMFLRKDNGSISPFVTRLSVAISTIILCCGSILILY